MIAHFTADFFNMSAASSSGFRAVFTCEPLLMAECSPGVGVSMTDSGTLLHDGDLGYQQDLDCNWYFNCLDPLFGPVLTFEEFLVDEYDQANLQLSVLTPRAPAAIS
eukprot:COSAG06_NODE_47901_length_336_cov_0.565401_1_plen_106_part_01